MTQNLISINKLSKTYSNGLQALKDVSLDIKKGEIIAMLGPNGAGKTTMLRLIQGELELDSGSVDVKPGVQMGYFHQDHRSLNFDLTPVEQVRALKPRMDYGDIRALLGRFQFTNEMVETKLGKFSGGERARIALLKLLLEDNNLLLLDEPTNHLDLDATLWLERWLGRYAGTLLTIAHDRDFLDATVHEVIHLEATSVKTYKGNYASFELQRSAELARQTSLHRRQEVEI